jgi:hypothetical protein
MAIRYRPWRRVLGGVLVLVGAAVLVPGCGGSSDDTDDGGNLPRAGSRAGGSGGGAGFAAIPTSGSSGAGGALGGKGGSGSIAIPGGGQGNESSDDGAAGTPTIGKGDACATASDTAVALPSVLQLVVDISGSMDWPPGWEPITPSDSKPSGATKWEITREALLDAVAQLPADVALGVNFYPDIGNDDERCINNRVAVPIQLLGPANSAVRRVWEIEVNDVEPNGATPTHGAYLFGLAQLAATDLPGSQFLLLLTDGTPTCNLACQCNEGNVPVDSGPLIEEAGMALESGVRTFVIGSPGSEETREVLSELASEGGTGKSGCDDEGPNFCHFDMTTEDDLGAGLTRALQEIAQSLRSCEYVIPAPPVGETLDRNRVNVLYTSGSGDTETIGRDPSASDCESGWQYSEDGARVVLCGDTCARVRADVEGTVEVLFGCETVTNPEPR